MSVCESISDKVPHDDLRTLYPYVDFNVRQASFNLTDAL